MSGGLQVLARRRRQLVPSAGLVAAELWGHRLVRLTLSPLSHLALLVLSATKMRSSTLARAFLLANLVGCIGLVAGAREAKSPAQGESTGSSPRRLLAVALSGSGQVMFLQAVALGGMVRYARG